MARGHLHYHTTHPRHPGHLHSDMPRHSEFTYDEKSNRSMFVTGVVLSSIGAVLLTLSILGFVEVITYNIAIPFLIASVCLLALGLQLFLSALSSKKQAASMVKCPNCGAYNKKEDTVCYKCEKNLVEDAVCPNCGTRLKSEGEICPDCGYAAIKTEASHDTEASHEKESL